MTKYLNMENDLQEIKIYLENIINHVPHFIFWKDRESRFLGCNKMFSDSVQLPTPAAVIGKTDYDMPWPKEHSDIFIADDQQVMDSGISKLNYEELQGQPDGSQRVMLVSKVPLFNEENQKVIGILGIYTDITERKRNEKQLKQAKEQAEVANEIKTEFIENMQHDIRTPASGVWSMLAIMAKTETDPEKKERLTLMEKSAKQLLNLCNDVIDFDRIQRGETPFAIKKINIRQLVNQIVDINRAAAFNKKLTLNLTIAPNVPPVLKGDEHRLSRILLNLVGNAIKFTNQGGISLFVKLNKIQEKDVLLQFEVHDTGSGIPEEKKNYIYEKFNRLTPSNRGAYTGSGLGLQIVKKFVEELNGEIDVHSEVGKGTIFYITLAFKKPLTDDIYDEYVDVSFESDDNLLNKDLSKTLCTYTQQSSTHVAAHTGIQVLLIEDDDLARMAAQSPLQEAGCLVTTADTVQEALKCLDLVKYDLVISDIGLPDGSGFDIIRAVKGDLQSPNYATPFLALTAHSDKKRKEEAITAGFSAMLAKPLMQDQVGTLIEIYINNTKINPKENVQPPKTLSIVDLKLSKNLTGGNEKLSLELLDMLCAELPEDVKLIQAAREKNNIKQLRDLLHKLKGGLCYCGVPRLQHVTNELHDEIKMASSLSKINPFFERFYEEVARLLDEHEKLKSP